MNASECLKPHSGGSRAHRSESQKQWQTPSPQDGWWVYRGGGEQGVSGALRVLLWGSRFLSVSTLEQVHLVQNEKLTVLFFFLKTLFSKTLATRVEL